MGTVFVPDEPTAFHLCYAQRRTPGTRHFAGLHRQVHVFSGVSVLIVYTQLTDALGEGTRWVGIRTTIVETTAAA